MAKQLYYSIYPSQFCEIILVRDDEGIVKTHLCTDEGKRTFSLEEAWIRDDDRFADAHKQLDEYFSGERFAFDLSLNMGGTRFQKSVWEALCSIPLGELRTYRQIARQVGNEKACRAVGMANSLNPIPLIVPCHRVVGSGGKLTGFAHGLSIKQKLIDFEAEIAAKR